MRKANRLLAVLAIAAGLLFAFDAALFRTGLYRPFVEPQSYAGQAELALRQASAGQPSGSVLVLGDSRIAEGFSSQVANREAASPGRFINASVPGSTLRCWYYLLREADPTASRFHAVVIPFDDYQDEDGAWDWADRVLDLRIAIYCLRLSDIGQFASSYRGWGERFDALRGAAWKGFVLKDDLQPLLLHPFQRIEKARQWEHSGLEWVNGYTGNPANMLQSVAPAPRPLLPQNGRYAEYRRLWLTRILTRYEGKATRIVVIRVPRGPFPQEPAKLPSVLRELRSPALTVVDESTFAPLEKPEFFFDSLHLNAKGREAFSKLLAKAVD